MKRKKKRSGIVEAPGIRGAGTNPGLQAQTRKVLRTHYAAKYRVR